ncbi:transcriptional regulator [Pseudoclavibacter sp. RFBI5]|uniref:metal-dependent transcriptional regulator n=1 Tax=Pseudoclavibacter sp. RFBI5 TaxID=2080578 RepID=UPI000CE7428F|nr:metal-dependent transcriptional regulator [Pseudoclavibacter sp. RFBI5]PPG00691.1 transcriptional regulator [Pseudoclavibacter sp. RFBI5]
MSVSELSVSAQNYLKVVWSLQEWSDAPVTATIVAERLQLRLSTVSEGIRKLADQGLLEHARYGSISLTTEGRAHALTMIRRHRLLETFLVEVLQYGWDEVHDEAENLEHSVSDLMVERIDAMLGHPERDPHGDPIPSAAGEVSIPQAVLLSSLEAGKRVVVERISDSDAELLKYFAAKGLTVGARLEIGESDPYSESMLLTVADVDSVADHGEGDTAAGAAGTADSAGPVATPFALGPVAARAVWVTEA